MKRKNKYVEFAELFSRKQSNLKPRKEKAKKLEKFCTKRLRSFGIRQKPFSLGKM